MNKDILTQYCDIKKEIKDLEERLEKVKKQCEMAHDVVQNGYKRHLVIRGYDRSRLDRIEKYQDKLKTFNDKLLDTRIKVEEYIQSIENSRIRQILRYRYIDDYTWTKIGHKMHFNSDGVRKEHDRFLNK